MELYSKVWLNRSLRLRAFLLLALCLICTGTSSSVWAQEGARREEGEKVEPAATPKLTAPPQLLEAATPEYPPDAEKTGQTAEVKVRIRIEADGSVSRVDVVEPVGNGFDEAAQNAVRGYRFSPAEWDGVPGAIEVTTVIHFVLEEKAVEPIVDDSIESAELPSPTKAELGPLEHGGDMRKPISVSGVALERGTRRKLPGVIVAIAELNVEAVSDEWGRFYFHGVPAGQFKIVAVADRFDRFGRNFEIADNEGLELKLYMRPQGGNPYETVVEGEREALEVTRRTLKREQLTTVPGTFGDPIRVIQSLPGLARTPFVTGFLLVRGSNPDDSGVFFDGHRVPLLFHFLGGPSVLNGEFLDQIDLYPGGFPARYGRSIGGIVSVESRSSASDGVHGSVDIDLLDAGGYLRVPVSDKASIAVAGRRSYLDFMLGFFLPEDEPGQTLVVVPIYDDQQVRFDYDLESEGKASLFFIRSSDTLKVLSEDAENSSSQAINTSIRFYRLMAKYERPLANGFKLTLSPSLGTDSFSLAAGLEEGEDVFTGIDVQAQYLSYRLRVEGKINNMLTLDTGLDLESRRTRYELFLPLDDDLATSDAIDIPPEQLIRNVDTLMFGTYIDLGIDLDKLRIVPGLRFDSYLLNGHSQWTVDPRLIGRYQLSDSWLLKGYTGYFHQPPQPEALDSQFGNPEVEAEKALHVGLGGEWNFAQDWDLDFEGYFIDRTNQVVSSDRVVVDEASGEIRRLFWENTRVGDTIGFEFLLRRQVTRHLFGWTSYTLSKTRDRRKPSSNYRPATFDQRHTLNVVASYKTDSNWEFGGRFRLSTGRPITDVIDGTFDADSGDYDSVRGPFRGARRKTFCQLDVRAEKTWVFDTWKLGVYLDIQNVLNTENEEGLQYDYRFREKSPISSVPFVPTLGVRGQF